MANKKLNRIKSVLADKDKTSKWLAEELGKDKTTISKWCTNTNQPGVESLIKISKLLGVEVNDLLIKKLKKYHMKTESIAHGACQYNRRCYKYSLLFADVSDNFNKGKKEGPFKNSGVMSNGNVYTLDTIPQYNGLYITLGDILVDEYLVPNEFFISDEDLPKWEYQKGSKFLKRINKATGFEYNYSEGAMAFPAPLDRASRTIITGEGGAGPSRFKHIKKRKADITVDLFP